MFDPISLVSALRVCALTSLPKSTLRDYVKSGDFPRPVKVGPRRVAWRIADINDWIESRPSTAIGISATSGKEAA